MYLIPFARLSLYSPKSLEAVSLLLIRAVPPDDGGSKRIEYNLCEYFGSIWQDAFLIRRNQNYGNTLYPWIIYRNPFVPIIHGTLKPYREGTKVSVTAVFSPFILGFSTLFYTVFLLPLMIYVYQMNSQEQVNWNMIFLFSFFPLLLYLWHTISFNYEVTQVKAFLAKVILTEPLSGKSKTPSTI